MKALLLLLLAISASAATKPWLEDNTYATQKVEVLGGSVAVTNPIVVSTGSISVTGSVAVTNAVIVTTVQAAVPIQRSQAVMGRFYRTVGNHLTSGTAQTPSFLFVNLSTNSVSAYWDAGSFNSIEANINSHFHIYLDPVVTSSGTSLPIFSGTQVAPASKMQAFHAPTVSSNGTVQMMTSALGQETRVDFRQSFIIPPGRKVLISVANSSNNRQTVFGVSWVEE